LNVQTLFVERSSEENAARSKSGHAAYAARLAVALGNGAEWEYRGECYELQRATGKCACGHCGLKYLFKLHHPRRGCVEVGSSCIVSYHGITPELAARLQADVERLMAAARERERLARLAAQNAEVQRLLLEWSAAEYATDQAAADWHNAHQWARWYPGPIYRRPLAQQRLAERAENKLHPYCRLPALKTTSGQLKRLKGYLAKCARELAEVRTAN
jgi:hypothetical protein